MNRKISILGGGLAGLSVADALIARGISVHLYTPPAPLDRGASWMPAALLHPYGGRKAEKTLQKQEAFLKACQLIGEVEEESGSSFSQAPGLLRLAKDEEQESLFAKSASGEGESSWWPAERVSSFLSYEAPFGGLWIPQALVVELPAYLAALQKRLSTSPLFTLSSFLPTTLPPPPLILACGAKSSHYFPEVKDSLKLMKGQALCFQWPPSLSPPPSALLCGHYLLPLKKRGEWIGGATFEHSFEDGEENLPFATARLLPPLSQLYPPLRSAKISGSFAAIRAMGPHHHPLVKEVRPHQWIFSGLGSRGLLWHALLAQKLAREVARRLGLGRSSGGGQWEFPSHHAPLFFHR